MTDVRIIPAYAGSTQASFGSGIEARDHPRLRGEHELVESLLGDTLGSSPPTRGAPEARSSGRGGSRIIPAYAGSTLCELDFLCQGSTYEHQSV